MKEFIDKLNEKLEEAESVKNFGSKNSGNLLIPLKDAISIINKLAEEYKVSEMPTGWIPCSERLPEVNKKVLAFDVFSGISIEKLEEDEEFIESVIAWMPLPTAPYTEGE